LCIGKSSLVPYGGSLLTDFDSSADIQRQRLMARDGSTHEEASARLNSQIPISDKIKYADHVIDNSGSIAELNREVSAFLKKLEKEIGGWRWLVSWLIPPLGFTFAAYYLIRKALERSKSKQLKSS
jgi:dephospho-CoA kinase